MGSRSDVVLPRRPSSIFRNVASDFSGESGSSAGNGVVEEVIHQDHVVDVRPLPQSGSCWEGAYREIKLWVMARDPYWTAFYAVLWILFLLQALVFMRSHVFKTARDAHAIAHVLFGGGDTTEFAPAEQNSQTTVDDFTLQQWTNFHGVDWLSYAVVQPSIKVRTQDIFGLLVLKPLSYFFVNDMGFGSITIISANMVSFFHLFVAAVAAYCVSLPFLWARRMGAFLYMTRSWLDFVDGMVARVHRHQHYNVSGWGSWGFVVDAVCDFLGGIMLVAGGVVTQLVRYPPSECVESFDTDLGKPLQPAKVNYYRIFGPIVLFGVILVLGSAFWDDSVHSYVELMDVDTAIIVYEKREETYLRLANSNLDISHEMFSRLPVQLIDAIQVKGKVDTAQKPLKSKKEALELVHELLAEERVEFIKFMMRESFTSYIMFFLWQVSSADAFLVYLLIAISIDKLYPGLKSLVSWGIPWLFTLKLLSVFHAQFLSHALSEYGI